MQVDIIVGKDEKIRQLEKRMAAMERQVNKNFDRVSESFDTFRDVVLKLQKENGELKKDRDFLLARYKEVLRLPGVQSVKNSFVETKNIIEDIALEGTGTGKRIDDLFELVMKREKIASKTAARELGLTEDRVRYFAASLQKQGLIAVDDRQGSLELAKK